LPKIGHNTPPTRGTGHTREPKRETVVVTGGRVAVTLGRVAVTLGRVAVTLGRVAVTLGRVTAAGYPLLSPEIKRRLSRLFPEPRLGSV
jgi:hypothetical protein